MDNVTAKFDQLGAPTVVVNTITVERLAPTQPLPNPSEFLS